MTKGERIALLTNYQKELIKNADVRIRLLLEKRRQLRGDSQLRSLGVGYSEFVTEREVSKELAKLSRDVSEAENDIEQILENVVYDLDSILSSEILKEWVSFRIPIINQIVEKLENLNFIKSEFGRIYKNKRVVTTNNRPQRYWLNDDFKDASSRRRIISFLNPNYPIQNIKSRQEKKYGNIIINVRETLKKAIELEEKGMSILSHSEKDAMTIVEIYHRIKKQEDNLP